MNSKKFVLVVFVHLFITCARCQGVPFEKYTSKNGLISDRITAIAQDDKGFMWFGSFFGICRYDGIKFEKIELPETQQNKYVNCLLSAGSKMYAGFLFGGGLAEYANGKVNSYFINAKDRVAGNEFICMADNGDGSIMLCTSLQEIYRFKNGRFEFLVKLENHPQVVPKEIRVDRNHNIWLATEKGLFIVPYPYKKLYTYYSGENIFSLVLNPQRKMCFSRTDGKRSIVQECDGFQPDHLTGLHIISQSATSRMLTFSGNTSKGIWGIDYEQGLMNISPDGKKSGYHVPIDFNTDMNILFADRENNIWIANEPGVLKVSNYNIQVYVFNEIAAGGSTIVLDGDSITYAGSARALYNIQGDSIKKTGLDLVKPDYYGLLFVDQHRNLWVGLWNGGLWRTKWNTGKLTEEKFFPDFNGVEIKANDAVEDHAGNTWITGANGIFHIINNSIIDHYQPVLASGSPSFANCLAIDEKEHVLWLGDNADGIIKVHYEFGPGNICRYSTIRYIRTPDGLVDSYIRSIYFDHQNNLWAGTRFGGLYRIMEKGEHVNIRLCNQEAELTCTRITDIVPEDTTALWFATCNGIYQYQYGNNLWQHYNTSNGLLNAEIFRIAVDAKNHNVWASSSQGITKFHTDLNQNKAVPLVSIIAVNVLGKPDTTALQASRGRYSSDENSIGFTFAGASFIDEKKIRYKYMLEGFDLNWSNPVFTNSVNYASLPPGTYTFKVLAANADGQWSSAPATFRFEVIRPFYKSPFVLFIAITLCIFIIYMLRIQRLKQRYKIESLRLNIARDLHDDIGSTLGSINLLSKTATRKMNTHATPEDMEPIFQKIGQSAEDTLEAMDDIVWSINPSKDKVYDLVIRMREFAIPLFEIKNIDFLFEVEADNELHIPMDLRRNVFLIYKESIHNILKHADADSVSVSLHIGHHQFRMSITDNGKGFSRTLETRRNGLKNMNGRAEMVHGTINIHSSGNGTHIDFTAPIR